MWKWQAPFQIICSLLQTIWHYYETNNPSQNKQSEIIWFFKLILFCQNNLRTEQSGFKKPTSDVKIMNFSKHPFSMTRQHCADRQRGKDVSRNLPKWTLHNPVFGCMLAEWILSKALWRHKGGIHLCVAQVQFGRLGELMSFSRAKPT